MCETVQVACFTNLDAYKQAEWPAELPVRPLVGDYVQELGGFRALRVIAITHVGTQLVRECPAFLRLELHK